MVDRDGQHSEVGTIASPATVMSAVVDALSHLGVTDVRRPASPENVWNAIQQAKQFQEAVGVTAIALTKLDGTAKGGVVIGISDELKIPVAWAGVGEKVEDLRPFDPKEFVAARDATSCASNAAA